jgi:hypothetical protein
LEEAAMNEEKNGFDVESSDITASRGLSPAAVVEKWRIAVALLAATVSFLLLTLITFIATAWAGFQFFLLNDQKIIFLTWAGHLYFLGFAASLYVSTRSLLAQNACLRKSSIQE